VSPDHENVYVTDKYVFTTYFISTKMTALPSQATTRIASASTDLREIFDVSKTFPNSRIRSILWQSTAADNRSEGSRITRSGCCSASRSAAATSSQAGDVPRIWDGRFSVVAQFSIAVDHEVPDALVAAAPFDGLAGEGVVAGVAVAAGLHRARSGDQISDMTVGCAHRFALNQLTDTTDSRRPVRADPCVLGRLIQHGQPPQLVDGAHHGPVDEQRSPAGLCPQRMVEREPLFLPVDV
jgi:hypothetical protein